LVAIQRVIADALRARKDERVTELAACEKRPLQEKDRRYCWLEDYLERLEGKEAYREFQEREFNDPEYYVLVASLAG
jgi:hypothetical protein